MYLSWANKKYHRRTGTPYIVSPHGMLDKWQLNQSFLKNLKKNIALSLYERKHLEGAACLHALCREEHDAIRSFGLRNPIAIIPNGIDLHEINHGSANRTKDGNTKKRLLFLGRIHVKKGLDNLLTAWSLLPNDHQWELVVAGETKDIAYQQSLLQKLSELHISDSVSFIGGQFGDAKLSCFRDSAAFILPSFSEGLPMSVLEAWSHELPVLMTSECNLPEGFAQQAAIRIDTDAQSISKGIREMIAMEATDRIKMGQNGLALVKERFSWGKVADSMTLLYQWVMDQAPKPGFVFYS
jgi:poly(glycerol-phosphate) alpha-glucosyltransferase